MGEFNSDGHYMYCCVQESLTENEVVIIVNKKVQIQHLGAILKMTE